MAQTASGIPDDFDLNKAVLYAQKNGIPINPQNMTRLVPVIMEMERNGQMQAEGEKGSASQGTGAGMKEGAPSSAPVPPSRPNTSGQVPPPRPGMEQPQPTPATAAPQMDDNQDDLSVDPITPLVVGAAGAAEGVRSGRNSDARTGPPASRGLDGDVMPPEQRTAIPDQRNTSVTSGRNANPRNDTTVTMNPPNASNAIESRPLPALEGMGPGEGDSPIAMRDEPFAAVSADRGNGMEDAISYVNKGREFILFPDGTVMLDGQPVSGQIPPGLIAQMEASRDPMIHMFARVMRQAF